MNIAIVIIEPPAVVSDPGSSLQSSVIAVFEIYGILALIEQTWVASSLERP